MNYTNEMIEEIMKEYMLDYRHIEKATERGIVLYGAGFVGTWAANYFIQRGVRVRYFIDSDEKKWGQSVEGIEIIAPKDERIKENPYILITARHAVKQIMSQYDSNEITCMAFECYYCIKHYAEYSEVRDAYMEDRKSVITYNALLYTMLTGDTKSCMEVMEKDMYFSLPEFSGTFDEIFVDAGAFTGDSVERFIWENLGTFQHIYAFEPGDRQFKALEVRMERLYKEWGIEREKVSLEKKGVSNKESKMSCIYTDDYAIRHTLSSEEGKNSVETCTLDGYLAGKAVSFIKVDIEGMEMQFLEGAKNTIMQYKPKMALCAYHYPCDLYSIAKYVKQLVPEYKFKLRLHAPFFGDFVLYCYLD